MAGSETVPMESAIFVVRGQRAILAAELAKIYGVETRAPNQAVKRNIDKFPDDFMFRLTPGEVQDIAISGSQNVILKRGQNIKYLPYAFTEHGAIMAANVINSSRAVQMSVFVVRAFVHLRQLVASHKEIVVKLTDLERQVASHDSNIRSLVDAIRQLMAQPEPKKRTIGFIVKERATKYGKSKIPPPRSKSRST